MEEKKLYQAIKSIAWGYIFLHLNFNLGRLNILPNWWGCLLILGTLPLISKEEPSADLLRPLGILLTFWEGILWVTTLFGISLNGFSWIGIIISVLSLYFHFQLLTNLASIAGKHHCPEEKNILHLRTVRTCLCTLMALPIPWERYETVTLLLVIVNLLVTFWICSVLFSLSKNLAAQEETL